MNLFIFKTDLNSSSKIFKLRKLLSDRTRIKNWSIDLDDKDKVLKVFTINSIQELELASLIEANGIKCEALE